jgi:hypothetical protein
MLRLERYGVCPLGETRYMTVVNEEGCLCAGYGETAHPGTYIRPKRRNTRTLALVLRATGCTSTVPRQATAYTTHAAGSGCLKSCGRGPARASELRSAASNLPVMRFLLISAFCAG